jgi:hypothetical protein
MNNNNNNNASDILEDGSDGAPKALREERGEVGGGAGSSSTAAGGAAPGAPDTGGGVADGNGERSRRVRSSPFYSSSCNKQIKASNQTHPFVQSINNQTVPRVEPEPDGPRGYLEAVLPVYDPLVSYVPDGDQFRSNQPPLIRESAP